jgi:NADPH:quinone reductase-like Zn-dependent oxidoreductase
MGNIHAQPQHPIEAKYTVAVLGAAGGIGQTLSLLMKQNKYIKSLRLCTFLISISVLYRSW